MNTPWVKNCLMKIMQVTLITSRPSTSLQNGIVSSSFVASFLKMRILLVLKNYFTYFQLLTFCLGSWNVSQSRWKVNCLLCGGKKLATQFAFVSLLLFSIKATKLTEIIRMALLIEVSSLGFMEVVMVYWILHKLKCRITAGQNRNIELRPEAHQLAC